MKKVLYLCGIVLCLTFFTGCSSRSLNCNMIGDYNDDLKWNQQLKIKFSNDHVTKLSTNMNVSLSGQYSESKSSLIESVESEFSQIINEKGVKSSTTDTDDGFNYKISINFNKLSDEVKKKISIVDYSKTYDYIKNDLEEAGYICE